jgi:CHAT domain-containing protein
MKTTRQEKRKRSRAAYLANITRKEEDKRIKKKLLILECTSEPKEQKSESLLLIELLRILEPAVQQLRIRKVRGRSGFIRELQNADELFIHVSAHGKHHTGKRVRGTFICFPSGGRVDTNDLKDIWAGRSDAKKPKLIVLSACETGHKDMATALYEAGCRYLVAPMHETYWFDAAVFLTIFYRLLLVENHRPWVAFKKTDYALKRIFPNLTGVWAFFDRGERVLYEE